MKSGKSPAHSRKSRTRSAAVVPPARDSVRQHFPAGTRVSGPEGGWWSWSESPEPIDTSSSSRTAVRQGISYTPGASFSASGKYGNCSRLNIARPWTPPSAAGSRASGQAMRARPAG
ncbi:hypothetical protein OY671_010410 [Metschnikowia pulcherrima]|nr:hypothetical protein OY671_010410 [Metschnikowia pulcherrima]